MTSFFGVGGNPFATVVGQKIEQATDGSLASENWTLNMEICDLISETEDGPKDAIKAIRKRLQQSVGKNYTIVMFTLTVLETCVKNCGRRFHLLACNKEFIAELVKIIGPKNDPPTAVQEKVLSLIQAWADAFHAHPELSGVVQAYQELKAKGIEFPMTDLDAMAPIHTPRKVQYQLIFRRAMSFFNSLLDSVSKHATSVMDSVSDAFQSVKESVDGGGGWALSGSEGGPPLSSSSAAGEGSPVALTPDQLSKLRSDLDILQTNMTVFGEMINEMSPGNEHPSDLQLFQELHATLLEMQERLVELISRLSNDEVTADLLRINDHLNNLFLRYSRYEKNREASKDGREKNGQDSLIDLTEEAAGPVPPVTQMAGLGIGSQLANLNTVSTTPSRINEKDDKDFDAFAQSRNVDTTKDSGSSYESNRKPDQVSGNLAVAAEARAALGTPVQATPALATPVQATPALAPPAQATPSMHKESDFDEMEAWLEGGGDKSVTSSEFERFLEERAMAADRIPEGTNTNQAPGRRDADFDRFLSERAAVGERLPSSPARPPKGKDPQDSSLFAL